MTLKTEQVAPKLMYFLDNLIGKNVKSMKETDCKPVRLPDHS